MKALAKKLSSLGYYVDSNGNIVKSNIANDVFLNQIIKNSESKRVKRRRVNV